MNSRFYQSGNEPCVVKSIFLQIIFFFFYSTVIYYLPIDLCCGKNAGHNVINCDSSRISYKIDKNEYRTKHYRDTVCNNISSINWIIFVVFIARRRDVSVTRAMGSPVYFIKIRNFYIPRVVGHNCVQTFPGMWFFFFFAPKVKSDFTLGYWNFCKFRLPRQKVSVFSNVRTRLFVWFWQETTRAINYYLIRFCFWFYTV